MLDCTHAISNIICDMICFVFVVDVAVQQTSPTQEQIDAASNCFTLDDYKVAGVQPSKIQEIAAACNQMDQASGL